MKITKRKFQGVKETLLEETDIEVLNAPEDEYVEEPELVEPPLGEEPELVAPKADEKIVKAVTDFPVPDLELEKPEEPEFAKVPRGSLLLPPANQPVLDQGEKGGFADIIYFTVKNLPVFFAALHTRHLFNVEKHKNFLTNMTEKWRELRENKNLAIANYAEELKEAEGFDKFILSQTHALAQMASMTAYPEVRETIMGNFYQKSFTEQAEELITNPSKAFYMIGDIVLPMARDYAIAPGARFATFALTQATTSGISMSNEMSEMKRVTGDENINPWTYGLWTAGASLMGAVISAKFTKYAMRAHAFNNINKTAAFHTALGAIDGMGQNVIESGIRYTGLEYATDQEGIGTSMYAIMLAGLMGGSMGYARSKYAINMLEEMDKSNENFYDLLALKAGKLTKELYGGDWDTNLSLVKDAKASLKNSAIYKHLASEKGFMLIPDTDSVKVKLQTSVKKLKGIDKRAMDAVSADIMNTLKKDYGYDIDADVDMQSMLNDTNSHFAGRIKQVLKKKHAELTIEAGENMKDYLRARAAKDNPDAKPEDMIKLNREIDGLKNDLLAGKKDIKAEKSVFIRYFDEIKKNMPGDAEKVDAYLSERAADLNIRDTNAVNEVAKIMIESKTDFNPELIAGKVTKRLKEITNLSVFESQYSNLKKLTESMGDTSLKPLHELTDGKLYMDDKIYKEHSPKVFALIEKYKTAHRDAIAEYHNERTFLPKAFMTMRKLTDMAFGKVSDPLLRERLTSLEHNLTQWGSQSGWLSKADDAFLFGGKGRKGYYRYIKENKLDSVKIRKYLDTLFTAEKLKMELDVKEVDIDGIRTRIPVKVVKDLGMQPREILAAHKLSNFLNKKYQMFLLNSDAKAPFDLARQVQNMPDFASTDSNYNGNSYHPTNFNEKGKAAINETYNISDWDSAVKTKFTKRRGYDRRFASQAENRLAPEEEIYLHLRTINNSTLTKGVYGDLEAIAIDYLGYDNIKFYEDGVMDRTNSWKHVVDLNPKDEVANLMYNVNKQMDAIFFKPEKQSMATEIASNTLGFMYDGLTKAFIGPQKIFYHLMNTSQVYTNMTQWVGFKNVFKTMPKGYASMVKFLVKNGANVTRHIADVVGTAGKKDPALGKLLNDYLKEYYSPSGFKSYLSLTGDEKIMHRVRAYAQQAKMNLPESVANKVDYLSNLWGDAMAVSDVSSRIWGVSANKLFLDDVFKKYKWTPKDASHAVSKYNNLVKDLGVDRYGAIASQNLRKALVDGLKSGDMSNFYKQHTFYTVDSGLYHYNIANRQAIFDYAKKAGKIAAGSTRFLSWTLYDYELQGKILRDAVVNNNYSALGKVFVMAAISSSVKYMLKDEVSKSPRIRKGQVGLKNILKFADRSMLTFDPYPQSRILSSAKWRVRSPLGLTATALTMLYKFMTAEDKIKEAGKQIKGVLVKSLKDIDWTIDKLEDMYNNTRATLFLSGDEETLDAIEVLGDRAGLKKRKIKVKRNIKGRNIKTGGRNIR